MKLISGPPTSGISLDKENAGAETKIGQSMEQITKSLNKKLFQAV
jgi:hypothetical protein